MGVEILFHPVFAIMLIAVVIVSVAGVASKTGREDARQRRLESIRKELARRGASE